MVKSMFSKSMTLWIITRNTLKHQIIIAYPEEIVHNDSPVPDISLDNAQESGTVQPQQLTESFGPYREQLRSIAKHANLATEFPCLSFPNNLKPEMLTLDSYPRARGSYTTRG